MILGNHMRRGVGNNSHAVALIQSDQADTGTTFADSSRGGAAHVINARGGIEHKTTVGSPLPSLNGSAIRFQAARWLDMADHVDWAFGDGDFTIDTWVRPDAAAAYVITSQCDSAVTDMATLFTRPSDGRLRGYVSDDGGVDVNIRTPTAAAIPGAWTHCVFQRLDGVIDLYANGVRGETTLAAAYSIHDSALDFFIGRFSDGVQQFVGYMSEIRVTKGQACYPVGGFTVPNRMS